LHIGKTSLRRKRKKLKNGEGEIDMDELINLDELQKVLHEYAKDAEQLYKSKITDGGKNASKKLLDSVKSNVIVGENAYEVTLTLEHYWKYVEFGRQGKVSSPIKAYQGAYPPGKAAFPPVDALLEWIKVKPVIPRPGNNGRIPTPKQLAYLIGRKIEREGIEPFPALHNTQEELNKLYKEKIEIALGHDISNYIRKIIPTK
jgi:hypothetical protein